HQVRQEAEEARPLDGAGELALLAGRDRGDAARHELAALGDVAAEEPRVLVVDLRRVIAGERTGLAAAMERAPRGAAGSIGHGSAPLAGIARRRGVGVARRTRPAFAVAARSAALAIPTEAAALAVPAETAAAATGAAAATAISTEAAATATETTAFAAEAPAVAVAALVAVALAHLDRRLGLVRLDPDCQEAKDVGGEPHTPLHLGHGGRRRIDVDQREVRLAILLDLVGERLDAPVFGLADLA